MLIEPSKGKTYAEVLGLIRSRANPEASQVDVRAIRQTGSGRVLLELVKKSQDKAAFCDTVKTVSYTHLDVYKRQSLSLPLSQVMLATFLERHQHLARTLSLIHI